MIPTHQQAILSFLHAKAKPHMAARYNANMEVQVNVAKGTGSLVVEDRHGKMVKYYKDDLGNEWKDFRIPYGANTDTPEWTDRPLPYDLARYADSIGMTGWDWVDKVSRFTTYDFDSITNHVKAGLSEEEMAKVIEALSTIDWVTIQRSTSGGGYHVYVEFEPPVPTGNHTEHAALARAVLDKMSAMTSRDFVNDVDVCGGNIWIWARRQNEKSFEVIKKGSAMDSGKLPSNWRDCIPAMAQKGGKNTVSVFDENGKMLQDLSTDGAFEDFVRKQNRCPLDKGHEKLFRWLEEHGCAYHWDRSRHLMRTHTRHLLTAKQDPALEVIGPYDTTSSGTTAVNCFCFPHPDGSWEIRRYGEKVNESALWEKMPQGWTRCFFNRFPDLKVICKAKGGAPVPGGAGYQFTSLFVAQEVLDAFGVKSHLPPELSQRPAIVRQNERTGMIEVTVAATKDEQILGWAKAKNQHILVLEDVKLAINETYFNAAEDQVMYLVMNGGNYGWAIWNPDQLKPEMTTQGCAKSLLYYKAGLSNDRQAQTMLGRIITKPWQIVNVPFAEEFLAGRQWNKGAARLAISASKKDFESLEFPTWERVLKHLGQALDSTVQSRDHAAGQWCCDNGIQSGYHYLMLWIAAMFQYPFEQLPLLFLHSQQQNTGKSTLHEALKLLFRDGAIGAEAALRSQAGFNKELQGRILVYIEEVDFSKDKGVYNKLKDWITAKELTIHEKGKTPYTTKNTTHWIYCSNNFKSIPVHEDDTRITMVHVAPIPLMDLIPKSVLMQRLMKEAPEFLAYVMQLEVPATNDRLRIPALKTQDKMVLESINSSSLTNFLKHRTVYRPGELVTLQEFCDAFLSYVQEFEPGDVDYWQRHIIKKNMPPEYPMGRSSKLSSAWVYGNIRLLKPGETAAMYPSETGLPKFIKSATDDFIRPERSVRQ